MRHTIPVWAALACLFVTASHSAGAFVSLGHPTFGADSITWDTDTGFGWLDVEETVGRAANDVTANLGPGGEFEGFRFAVEDEVLDLFRNAGIPDVPDRSAANIAPAQALMDFIGSTTFQAGIGDGREVAASLATGQGVDLDGTFQNQVPMMIAGGNVGRNPAFEYPGVANWLVAETVIPEPATFALAALGLAGLGGYVRRRRKA